MADSQDRQHNATPNRLQEAVNEGRFARSGQLASFLFLIGAFAVLAILGQSVVAELLERTKQNFTTRIDITGNSLLFDTSRNIWQTVNLLAPLLAMLLCVAYAAHAWQSRFRFFPSKLNVDFERISISSGFSKLFSGRNVLKTIGSVLRLLVIVSAGLYLIWSQHSRLAMLAFQSTETLPKLALEIGCWVIGGVLVLMFLFSMIDYAYKFRCHQEDLKLTDQEYRDEMRSLEGDPIIQSQQRSRHREMTQ